MNHGFFVEYFQGYSRIVDFVKDTKESWTL